MIDRSIVALLSASAGGLLLAGCATPQHSARLERFALGRNAAGETCAAARNWSDPAAPDPFARAYALTCSGAAANRPLGTLRAVARSPQAVAAIDAQFDCGEAMAVRLADGPAMARRCLDRVTGLESVRIDAERGDLHYVGAGAPALLPQIEEALAVVGGARTPSADVTRIPDSIADVSALPARLGAAPAQAMADAAGGINLPAALSQGIDLNHRGQHVEASRVLNDALSRLPENTPAATRAELLLETALADSNIRFTEAAAGHFAAADRVFAQAPEARSGFLSRKRETYRALDALNRQAFAEALARLDDARRIQISAQPLTDPAAMRLLNQPATRGGANAVALPDTAQLASLVLDAQLQYARSIALLGLGDIAGARKAIDAAEAAYRPLLGERLEQPRMLWFGSRVSRQSGRIRARGGDYEAALASYDSAVDMLRRSAVASGGTGSEPGIAEVQLERAAVYARTGVPLSAARDTYAEAIDALIASGSTGINRSIGMEDYLDLLVREAADKPQADTHERYFRAVQASGEPAVARQVTQLRSVVTADPAIARLVRERDDLERQITRLRYAIAGGAENAAGDTPAVPRAELEKARQAAEGRLIAVDAQLAADPRYGQVDETPATLAELRRSLRPGEAFVKLTQIDRRVYGLVVTTDRSFIYHVANSDAAKRVVDELAQQLRASIDGRLDQGKLVPFDEARAYTLWRLVAGPAADLLGKASAITVDPSGPLERLPIGALVTRYDPAAVREDSFDFSKTAFLARTASLSTALSPRSFLSARTLPPSRAPRRFLGLGEHRAPMSLAAATANRMVDVGYGCTVQYAQLTTLSRGLVPVNRRELDIAARALEAEGATMITDASFSDSAVQGRGDLDQYAVLHFATHGLEEGMWGCAKSPPALVTSFGEVKSDGLLDFSEIADLRLDANLVVLSACDTAAGVRDRGLARAAGQEEAGATLEGLVRAFLTANARAVLATHWQVSAGPESDAFMQAFYARGRVGTIGEALQEAQRTLIDQPEYSHPFYWAPYFLVGDSSKTMISQPTAAVASR